jgi:sporulation protein YlmC with PRC-barrel domain
MMVSYRQLRGFTVQALDGAAGRVKDFIFDEKNWAIRYIVYEHGVGALHRKNMLAPEDIRKADPESMRLNVGATSREVNRNRHHDEEIDLAKDGGKSSVSRTSWEILFHQLSPAVQPDQMSNSYRGPIPAEWLENAFGPVDRSENDVSLESGTSILGYHVATNDGVRGTVDDFIIDSRDWTVSHLVINVGHGKNGKRILVSPEWVDWVSRKQKKISISADKQTLEACPNFMLDIPLNPEDEASLNETFECMRYQERISA